MKKLCMLIALFLCLSFCGCSSGGGIDLNNDGKQDIKVDVPTIKVYTVRFDTNGGSNVSPKQITSLDAAPQTYRENHEFRGWYMDESLTIPVVYPLDVNNDITLYAKWLRVSDAMNCSDCSIKFMDNDFSNSYAYTITPPRFDLDTLATEGYIMEIIVEYNVHYAKDYDVLWDIGYMGAPKYEVYMYNNSTCYVSDKNLTTSKSPTTRTITYKTYATNIKNSKITLVISTDNVQNIIYFDNMTVTYNCYK